MSDIAHSILGYSGQNFVAFGILMHMTSHIAVRELKVGELKNNSTCRPQVLANHEFDRQYQPIIFDVSLVPYSNQMNGYNCYRPLDYFSYMYILSFRPPPSHNTHAHDGGNFNRCVRKAPKISQSVKNF